MCFGAEFLLLSHVKSSVTYKIPEWNDRSHNNTSAKDWRLLVKIQMLFLHLDCIPSIFCIVITKVGKKNNESFIKRQNMICPVKQMYSWEHERQVKGHTNTVALYWGKKQILKNLNSLLQTEAVVYMCHSIDSTPTKHSWEKFSSIA